MGKPIKHRLVVKDFGPIKEADVEFGDLTVLVGAQATGKSVFLETFKLAIDRDQIHDTFVRYNVILNDQKDAFFNGYYGLGMAESAAAASYTWKGTTRPLSTLTKRSKASSRTQKVFYIPAQRVMSFANGVPQNFGQFNYGDPYVLRHFSNTVHDLLQNEFGAKAALFPQSNRLNKYLRDPISANLFGAGELSADTKDFTKRLSLKMQASKEALPYLAWSAGQREFTPLLLGLYWLCPSGGISKRGEVDWVVIEEPEMGLHPKAIATTLLLVLELMRRGYKTVLSTHSTVVLDMIWALKEFQHLNGTESDVRRIFSLPSNFYTKELGANALEKDYRVYYFDRGKVARDISELDPASTEKAEAEWGGLSAFSANVGDAVAHLARKEADAANE